MEDSAKAGDDGEGKAVLLTLEIRIGKGLGMYSPRVRCFSGTCDSTQYVC